MIGRSVRALKRFPTLSFACLIVFSGRQLYHLGLGGIDRLALPDGVVDVCRIGARDSFRLGLGREGFGISATPSRHIELMSPRCASGVVLRSTASRFVRRGWQPIVYSKTAARLLKAAWCLLRIATPYPVLRRLTEVAVGPAAGSPT